MKKTFIFLAFALMSLSLSACITSSSGPLKIRIFTTAPQRLAEAPSKPKAKIKIKTSKRCLKTKAKHEAYGKEITQILWKYYKKRKRYKKTYKHLSNKWFSYVGNLNRLKYGNKFNTVKKRLFTNVRLADKYGCKWLDGAL